VNISCADTSHAVQGVKVKARLLVIADGATSRLATKLGYCTEPPRGVCSRAFVEGGTHNTDFDGETCPSFHANRFVLCCCHQYGQSCTPSAGSIEGIDIIFDQSQPSIVCDSGVCFYQKESLPGYSAIFKHPNDELNYCYYLIPHGKEGFCGDVHVRQHCFLWTIDSMHAITAALQ